MFINDRINDYHSWDELRERMLNYRMRHDLNLTDFAKLIDEDYMLLYRCETGKHKPHKKNEYRLTIKMDKLEQNRKEE